MTTDEPPIDWISENCVWQAQQHAGRAMDFRDKYGEDRVIDVHYADMLNDPMASMKKLYADLGDDFTPAAEAGMQGWLDDNPHNKFGKHEYKLDEFGLTVDQLRSKFDRYLSRYDIAARRGLKKENRAMIEGFHMQNAYVCDDLQQGIEALRLSGISKEPVVMPVNNEVITPDGPRLMKLNIALVWADDLQYELIEANDDEVGLYKNCLSNGGPLRFHHICMKVPDWDDFYTRAKAQTALPIAMENDYGPGQVKFMYLDARKTLGHYLEYIWYPDEQWESIKAM